MPDAALVLAPPPTPADVRAAAAVLRGVANRTPVLTSRTLDGIAGASVYLKCEPLQRTGAFKFRGAYNALSSLSPEARTGGVVTYSSGNHAHAVALAGRLLEVPTVVVMPRDAPRSKLAATRGYGAEVVLYDRRSDDREALAARLREERGSTLIPPYDHPRVIAGQGTAALELLEEAAGLEVLLAPCGGGGLLSGSALAAAAAASGCRLFGVEPAAADDATRSFRSGTLKRNREPPTIADGLRTPSLGRYTWPLVREFVAGFFTVAEDEIVAAMHFLWSRCKLLVEPSGAVALAPLLRGEPTLAGHRVGVILSGGNVDLERACELFAAASPAAGDG
ncbi:threo-3-hydroxy-L-aspartate ammonia-lyase [soil metagenome]